MSKIRIKSKYYAYTALLIIVGCLFVVILKDKLPQNTEQQNQNELVAEILHKWIGKRLNLPADIGYLTTNGTDVNTNLPTEDFKIVRYVDKEGCTTCKLHLYAYSDIITKISERAGTPVGFICIINPVNKREIRRVLRRDNEAGLTMWIDEADSLNRLNGFPEIGALQTFLVDGENRVLAIGDPAMNPRVMELFVDVLRSDSIRARGWQREALTQLVADAEERELGTVAAGDTARCRFVVRNVGEVDFVAEGVVSSCDCTRGRLSADTIRPGGEVMLEVEFSEAEAVGDFVRTVSVFGNTPRELTVEITGTVKGRKS